MPGSRAMEQAVAKVAWRRSARARSRYGTIAKEAVAAIGGPSNDQLTKPV